MGSSRVWMVACVVLAGGCSEKSGSVKPVVNPGAEHRDGGTTPLPTPMSDAGYVTGGDDAAIDAGHPTVPPAGDGDASSSDASTTPDASTDATIESSAHCGPADRDCLGAPCVAGMCQAESVLLTQVAGTVLDEPIVRFIAGNNLYLSNSGGTLNYRADLSTRKVVPVLSGDWLHLFDGKLFTGATPREDLPNGTKYGFELETTGAEETESKLVAQWEGHQLTYVSVDDYAVHENSVYGLTGCGFVYKSALDDLDAQPAQIPNLTCSRERPVVSAFDPSHSYLYTAHAGDGFIARFRMSDDDYQTISIDGSIVNQLLVTQDKLYTMLSDVVTCPGVTDPCVTNDTLIELDLADSSVRKLGSTTGPERFVGNMQLAGDFVYVGYERHVVRFALSGGPGLTIYQRELPIIEGFAVDDHHVYIGEYGSLLRVAR